jgi:hypothetical protein
VRAPDAPGRLEGLVLVNEEAEGLVVVVEDTARRRV